jgi:hypothetical protein
MNTTTLAATRTASVTGNWSSTTTWGGSSVPTSSDDVVINSGITVTVDANAECNTITINANSSSSTNGLTISGSNTLTVTGAVSMTAPSMLKSSLLAVNAGTLDAGSITIHGGTSTTSSLTVSTGTINCTGDVSFSGSSGLNLTFTGAGTINIGGNLGSGATFTGATGTVNFNGSGTQTIAGYTFNNLTISGTGGISAAGNLTVNGTLSVSSGSTLNLTSSYTLSGTLSTITNNGTIKTSYTGYSTPIPSGKTWSGTMEYAATNGSQTIVAGTYNDLQLDNTSGTNTAGGNLTVNGTLTIPSGGTLSMSSSGFFKLLGTLTTINNNGTIITYSHSDATPIPAGKTWSGTINYGYSFGGQTIVSGTYNNLTMATGTSNTAGGDITVNGTLTFYSLNLSTYKLDGNLTTVTFGGTIKTYSTQNPPFPAGIDWSANSGTVEFAVSTGGQYIPAGTYFNLQLDNTSNANTAVGNLTVDYRVTTQTNGTLDMSTYTLGGNLTSSANNGTIKTSNTSTTPIPTNKTWSGTIEYASETGGQTVVYGTYNNLKTDNTSGTNTAANTIMVSSTLTTATGGTLDMGTYAISGSFSTYHHNGILKTSNTSSTPFPSGKNWTTGGYTGTFEFAILSGGQTIPAGTYYNLQLDNTSGINTAGGILTVNGDLTTTAGGTLSMNSSGYYKLLGTLSTINNNGTIITYAFNDATPIPTGKTWGGTINYGFTSEITKQTVVAGTYNNLTTSGGGTNTAGGNITVNGTFTNGASENFETGNYTINCKGDVSNSGLCYDLGCGTGKILINGTSNQNINGGQFERLELDNTAGATLTNSITIKGSGTGCNSTLIMTNGNLNLNGNHITLETTYGAISGETNDRRIYDATDDGYITFTKTLSANTTYDNIAGMGIKIITDGTAPGSTVIKRGSKAQTIGSNSSIKRYFDVTPTTDQGLNATLRLSYFENELNGLQEAGFSFYRSTNTGSTWSTETPTSVDYTNNYVEKTAVNSLSRWTIGSACTNNLSVNPATTAICNGTSVELTASGASTYTWSNAATSSSITVNPTVTTTYFVSGTDGNGCTNIASATVTVNSLPNVTATGATICTGASANITASGAETYTWSNSETGNSITVNPTITSTYTVTGTNGSGCINTAQAIVIVNALPNVTASGATICTGSTATITASGADAYTWSNTETGSSITVSPTVTTTYYVTGIDGSGCMGTASATVIVCTDFYGTYTIGGTNADYPSITSAINDMSNNKRLTNAVIFKIRNGTYNEIIELGDNKIITKLNDDIPVIFMADSTDSIKVEIKSSDKNVYIKNKSNIYFIGLNFISEISNINAIQIINSEKILFSNCEINDTINGDTAIIVNGSKYIEFENIRVLNYKNGISAYNNEDGFVINNSIINVKQTPINVRSSENVCIKSNTIKNSENYDAVKINDNKKSLILNNNNIVSKNNCYNIEKGKGILFLMNNSLESDLGDGININTSSPDTIFIVDNTIKSINAKAINVSDTLIDSLSSKLLTIGHNKLNFVKEGIFLNSLKGTKLLIIDNEIDTPEVGILIQNINSQNSNYEKIIGNLIVASNNALKLNNVNSNTTIRSNTFIANTGINNSTVILNGSNNKLTFYANNIVNKNAQYVINFENDIPSNFNRSFNNWYSYTSSQITNNSGFQVESDGFNTDPKFQGNNDFSLSQQSLLLDTVPGIDSLILFDLKGNERKVKYDVGAIESPASIMSKLQVSFVLEKGIAFYPSDPNSTYKEFVINGLQNFANVVLKIYDNKQLLVYESASKNTYWNGVSMHTGNIVDEGYYFYDLTLDNKNLRGIIYVK